jgi:hypothetical protein
MQLRCLAGRRQRSSDQASQVVGFSDKLSATAGTLDSSPCIVVVLLLLQMMGGRLERSLDEVSELVTSRPAWMVSGGPSSFSEEQLKEYKEYMAKEAAAIEERLKRKGIMVS